MQYGVLLREERRRVKAKVAAVTQKAWLNLCQGDSCTMKQERQRSVQFSPLIHVLDVSKCINGRNLSLYTSLYNTISAIILLIG